MASQRRIRLLFYGVLILVICILIFTSRLRQTRPKDTRTLGDFYHKTWSAMEHKTGSDALRTKVDHDADGDLDADDDKLAQQMAERLRAAEQKAKDNANAKAPNKPDKPADVIGVGSSAGGQVKEAKERGSGEMTIEKDVKEVIRVFLEKSPVVIFSKSTCPYSKRAKQLLLEKYTINPAPHVVELDRHPMGREIQNRLKDMTGRGTVPNIMVNGKSIGGGDEIAALDAEGQLVKFVKAHGGKNVDMKKRTAEVGQKPLA